MDRDPLDKTIVTFACVLRMPLEDIPSLKLELEKNSDIRIVYQRTTTGFVRIVNDGNYKKIGDPEESKCQKSK